MIACQHIVAWWRKADGGKHHYVRILCCRACCLGAGVSSFATRISDRPRQLLVPGRMHDRRSTHGSICTARVSCASMFPARSYAKCLSQRHCGRSGCLLQCHWISRHGGAHCHCPHSRECSLPLDPHGQRGDGQLGRMEQGPQCHRVSWLWRGCQRYPRRDPPHRWAYAQPNLLSAPVPSELV